MRVPAGLSLTEAVDQYLATLSAAECQRARPEILRFVRWYGGERPIAALRGHEVESYVESLGSNLEERRLEPLRDFFAYARRAGLTKTNLSTHLRVKKPAKRAAARVPAQAGPVVQLTREGYAALQEELAALKAQRPKIAEQLRLARADKDFRENAPLDAARDAQAHLEARIREIEAILDKAQVITNNHGAGEQARVQLGHTVVVRNLNSGAAVQYTIVSPSEAAPNEGKLSAASPVGRALLERSVGEEVDVQVPAGVMRLRIERIEPSS